MESKIRAECMKAIRNNPGILRYELYDLNIGHRCSIGVQVDHLVYDLRVVRIWDDVMGSWRLYPKGKEPQPQPPHKVYRRSLYFKEPTSQITNHVHGEKFRMGFDEEFGILYIDLKILGVAAQEMLNGKMSFI